MAGSTPVSRVGTPMMGPQRAQFERDGYLIVADLLTETEVSSYGQALDRVYGTRVRASQVHFRGDITGNDAVASAARGTTGCWPRTIRPGALA